MKQTHIAAAVLAFSTPILALPAQSAAITTVPFSYVSLPAAKIVRSGSAVYACAQIGGEQLVTAYDNLRAYRLDNPSFSVFEDNNQLVRAEFAGSFKGRPGIAKIFTYEPQQLTSKIVQFNGVRRAANVNEEWANLEYAQAAVQACMGKAVIRSERPVLSIIPANQSVPGYKVQVRLTGNLDLR